MNAIARLGSPAWLRLVLLLVGLALSFSHAAAAAWPKDAEVSEGSTSLDGRYGIVLSSEGAGAESEVVNYLAELKQKRLLGKIAGDDYYQGENHRSLRVVWSAESRWCAFEYGNRYGFGSIFVLEFAGGRFVQLDGGKHVAKVLDAAINRQSRAREGSSSSSVWFRLGPGRALRVRATASNNSKRLEDVPTFYAAFAGTFDLKTAAGWPPAPAGSPRRTTRTWAAPTRTSAPEALSSCRTTMSTRRTSGASLTPPRRRARSGWRECSTAFTASCA